MAKRVAKKSSKTVSAANPTLHGLLVSRSLSGTVVRGLTFVVLVFGLVFVSVTAASGFSGLNALLTWVVMSVVYLLFDLLYVLLSNVRPLHPRLDRAILPLSLLGALVVVFTPVVALGGLNVIHTWVLGAIVLTCVLGVRFVLFLLWAGRDS